VRPRGWDIEIQRAKRTKMIQFFDSHVEEGINRCLAPGDLDRKEEVLCISHKRIFWRASARIS